MGLMTTCLRQEGVESLGINLLLTYIDDDDTDSKSLGVHIAKKLTEFVKGCSQVRTQSIVVMIRKLISPFCILYVVRQ